MRAGVCLLFLFLVGCDQEGSKENPGSGSEDLVQQDVLQLDALQQDALQQDVLQQDETGAVKWFRKAAEQGDASAQYDTGKRYDLGLGVTKNYKEADNWYR